MTLTSRNRIFLMLLVFSTAVFAAVSGVFILHFLNNTMPVFPQGVRHFSALSRDGLFRYNPIAVMCSSAVMLLYVPIFCFSIFKNFEKTHVQEILYFCVFLSTCLIEGIRICIPLFALWQDNTQLIIIITKVLFFGRLTSSLTMLTASLFVNKNVEQKTNNTQYSIVAFSIIAACVVPINSQQIVSTCIVPYAYYTAFLSIRVIFMLLASTSFYIAGWRNEITEYKKAGLFYLLLTAGQLMLQESDNICITAVGTILLFFGTIRFLNCIHQYYLWK